MSWNGGNGLLLWAFGAGGWGLWALNALIALMFHDGRSYMFLKLYFCNSFFLSFD